MSLLVPLDPALAQAVPGASREELQRAAPPSVTQGPGSARVDSSAVSGADPCLETLGNSAVTVPLTGVDFVGVRDAAHPEGRPLPPAIAALLAPIVKGTGAIDLDGSDRPISAVCAIRDAAEAALRGAHYLVKVQVPPQTIADGRLILTVITARIVDLRVRGDVGRNRSAMEPVLERLRGLDPLNELDAERILLTARDVPGASVTLVLRSADSGVPGEIIGEIAIERKSGALFVNVQNTGSEPIGRFGGLIRGELYGLTGLADRTSLGFYSASDFNEQFVLQGSHDFGIGGHGLRFAVSGAYAWTRPSLGDVGANFDLRSESLVASAAASYPLVRSVGANVLLGGGFELIEQRTRANATPINVDKLRVLFARLDVNMAKRSGLLAPAAAMSGSLELRKGINAFGTSLPASAGGAVIPSRFDGVPTAFVVRGRLGGEGRVRFGPGRTRAVTLAVEGRGQWSNDPLLAFEEFAIGNLTLGRGYDPGANSADRALGYSAELRIGKPVPQSVRDLAFEVVGFVDQVKIWNLDRQTSETNRSLLSAGGGVRATLGNKARMELIFAHPFDKALTTDDRISPDRLLLTFTLRALPW
jgi:hemolysin activation/secretion protein